MRAGVGRKPSLEEDERRRAREHAVAAAARCPKVFTANNARSLNAPIDRVRSQQYLMLFASGCLDSAPADN
jgi:hypothetical protein